MQLLDLHYEIVLTVLSILPDEALVKFSCTCREVCELASSQLQDRKYTALYGKIELNTTQSHDGRWMNPMQMVKAAGQDPIITQYIRSISYSPLSHYPPVRLPVTDDGDESYEIETNIEKLPFLGELEKQRWKEGVSERLDCLFNVSFVVLLSSCTKVTTLILNGLHDLPRFLSPLIVYLCNGQTCSNQLLPVFTTLGLCCPNRCDGLSLENDFTLLAIPTLRTLYLDKLVEEDYENWSHWAWTSEYNRSCSCETVEMFLGILNPRNLINLIGNLPQLKTLKYSHFYEFQLNPFYESQDEFVDLCWQFGESLLRKRSLQMTFGLDRGGQSIIIFEKLDEVEEVTAPLQRNMEGISRRFSGGAMIGDEQGVS